MTLVELARRHYGDESAILVWNDDGWYVAFDNGDTATFNAFPTNLAERFGPRKETTMSNSTLEVGAAVRVRGLNKGRPFHATISKLYANGKDVGVTFSSAGAIERFGKKALRVGVAQVALI